MERYRYHPEELAIMERSSIPFAVYQFLDRRVVTLVLSDGFCRLFGLENKAEAYELMDRNMYRDTHPDDVARIADAAFRFATQGGEYNVIYRSKAGADYIIVHAYGEHVIKEDGTRLAVVWYNNEGPYAENAENPAHTLSASLNSALHRETYYNTIHYDNLTGLPSMTYFFELADSGRRKMREAGEHPAYLFIDLSGMKFFNQKYGFAVGDRLLCEFSRVLAGQFGNENCCRMSQDHFAVFTQAAGLEQKLQIILDEARDLNDGTSLPVRAGVYLDQGGTEDVAFSFDRASYACDDLKGSYGSGFAYFQDAMLSSAVNRQYIIDNLDRALEEGWVKVFYQPIIRATNGRVCDEEALARWFDPVKGFLSPGEFIPVLEGARLIRKLDLYMLDQVLLKMNRQQAAGLYLVPQSINLSRADFDGGDIVEDIRRRVDEAGIPREKLTIEVTESMVGRDFDFMKEQIERFQALGFQVWMDDFGSGYSSLDLLQKIRFDLIKLDMRFMEDFDKGEESRIILTELVKMALALGIDTVAEGVETKEQADFLTEVGCTKLQGYYFCKPIPPKEIAARYRQGIQIGLENPEETDYYAALGRVNLYDLAVISHDSGDSMQRYFNTIPMAIMETTGDLFWTTRCNSSYRDYMRNTFGIQLDNRIFDYAQTRNAVASPFFDALMKCSRDGETALIEENTGSDLVTHSIIKRVAVNPVTGTAALVVAVLAVTDVKDVPLDYSAVAQALSADYMYLYYVDLETDQFSEYMPSSTREDLSAERHGGDFFGASRTDARTFLHEEDRDEFIRAFTKENILRAIDATGAFTWTYRQIINGIPTYVSMKAVRMGPKHLIIGVNNVDAQMKQEELLERAREAQLVYSRINALVGDFVALYLVDPETERYTESSVTQEYEGLGLAKEGTDFFRRSREDSYSALFPEDVERFIRLFTKENVLAEIRRSGRFSVNYRLLIDGNPVNVTLRAALLEESGRPQLIIGVANVDNQWKQVREYNKSWTAAEPE